METKEVVGLTEQQEQRTTLFSIGGKSKDIPSSGYGSHSQGGVVGGFAGQRRIQALGERASLCKPQQDKRDRSLIRPCERFLLVMGLEESRRGKGGLLG